MTNSRIFTQNAFHDKYHIYNLLLKIKMKKNKIISVIFCFVDTIFVCTYLLIGIDLQLLPEKQNYFKI